MYPKRGIESVSFAAIPERTVRVMGSAAPGTRDCCAPMDCSGSDFHCKNRVRYGSLLMRGAVSAFEGKTASRLYLYLHSVARRESGGKYSARSAHYFVNLKIGSTAVVMRQD